MDANTIMVWNLTRALPWRRLVRWRFALALYVVGLRRIAVRAAGASEGD
jgi:hypothetical protein